MKRDFIKKSGLLILTLIFVSFYSKAQNPAYNQLISIIAVKVPTLNVADKVIAFTAWSAANQQSRSMNQEFDRVCSIYQGAKLRNGNRGAVLISYNIDNASTATIAFTRDNIKYAIKVNRSEFPFLAAIAADNNVVYDNTGAKVYEGLAAGNVFMSFNQLITR